MSPRKASSCLPALLAILALSACASLQPGLPEAPATLYESVIINPSSGRAMTVSALARQVAGAEVIVVGEYHGHQAAHLLQSQLQAALYQQHPRQVLALEAFDLDHQQVVDRYLDGELGEEELMEDADAWSNYQASYRPLMEYARHHSLPVIAANAPDGVVRCVGRQGSGHVDSLAPAMRTLLPEHPFRDVPGYREKFLDTMGGSGHGHPSDAARERLENAYQAQLLRDNTMADRILKARQRHPGHQVLMVTGTFHAEQRLGLVGVLEQREPELDTVVISPVTLENDDTLPLRENAAKGDYLYFVQPLPERYRDQERQQAAMAEQFRRAGERDCR